MKTQDKNAVIALFMGKIRKIFKKDGSFDGIYCRTNGEIINIKSLKYHSDWNWLCLAVDKIENTPHQEDEFYNVTIGYGLECTIQGDKVDICKSGQTKIEAVHEAVYQFVVWHNAQVNQNQKP